MGIYVANPTSRKGIRELANTLRSIMDMEYEEYFPIVDFLELGLTELFKDFEYEIVSIDEMVGKYGVTYPEKNLIRLREDVYEGAIDGRARDRFTVAHEIGHFIMHSPGKIELARTQNIESIPAYKDPEWQANTFAGELLAPPQIIKGLSAREVALSCGVSLSVAQIQLKNI
ncbi:ImmA/IrrE family metallo-endopeptidase [Bacillus sp. BPN334]|uniref:ImmA/IrrE family metallo-endopeptidase n=1 Tax=Bacillus sp. BPN334 TaxID=2217815 RepID=UPI0011EBDFAC|nr:ImmA/IrrE family metallo-endopeptidase [Bacillus sp. BPN334]KAA0791764.1 ImmA/IrrE family metallo-endopeptidase [Bacillus sp. BPN334]